MGEYADSIPEIQQTFQELRKVLGEIPILASEQKLLDEAGAEDEDKSEVKTESTKPKVLADGTYATETAFTSTSSARLEAVKAAAKPPLRTLILGGDFFTGSVLSSALTKLVLRHSDLSDDRKATNTLRAEVRPLIVMDELCIDGNSLGNVDHGFRHPRWSIQVRNCPD